MLKRLIYSFLLVVSFSIYSNADIIEKNEQIPETHQVVISKTVNIDLSNVLKKDLIFFGDRESWAVEYDKSKSGLAKTGLVALSFLAGGMSAQGWSEMLNTNQYLMIYDLENNKNEKTRVFAMFVANKFDDESIIKNYLDKAIEKEIK